MSKQFYRWREKALVNKSLLSKRIPMYFCIHFKLYELIPKNLYTNYALRNEEWILWRKFDPLALIVLDRLRNIFGQAIVNNWHRRARVSWLKGNYEYRGIRPKIIPNNQKWAHNTTHQDWNTFDVSFKNYKIDEVYNFVLNNQDLFPEITSIEDIRLTPTWFHFSTSNFGSNDGKIRIVGVKNE